MAKMKTAAAIGHQTKADESIFARGQVAFGHGAPPVENCT
jgi:hypothetical protein